MGSRGPRPTPLKVLKNRGSWRGKLNDQEPTPERGIPDCPEWLDEYGRTCWAQVAPLLDGMGVLTKVDANALTRYCRLWARWRKLEEFLQQHGEVYPVKDENGKSTGLAEWPQAARAANLSSLLDRIEDRFGLNPSARSRIHAPQGGRDADDSKSAFFKVG